MLDINAEVVADVIEIFQYEPEEAELCVRVPEGSLVTPYEVWIETLGLWVRLDGEWISGEYQGDRISFRPTFWQRVRLRRWAKRWLRQCKDSRLAK